MISVCIATYNGEKYLREQIDSILSQLSDNDEVIISDDSSNDSTISILESYEDARIKIYRNQKFKSPIYNFENAIKHAKGDVIFLCDQDDIWLPNKVNIMVDALKNSDLVLSNCKILDASLNISDRYFFEVNRSHKGFFNNLIKNSYIGCCMAFRKSILNYTLPFPKNLAMHDLWIGLSVEFRGKTTFLNEPLMLYRRHGNNVSSSGEKSKNSFMYKISYRLHILYHIIKRII